MFLKAGVNSFLCSFAPSLKLSSNVTLLEFQRAGHFSLLSKRNDLSLNSGVGWDVRHENNGLVTLDNSSKVTGWLHMVFVLSWCYTTFLIPWVYSRLMKSPWPCSSYNETEWGFTSFIGNYLTSSGSDLSAGWIDLIWELKWLRKWAQICKTQLLNVTVVPNTLTQIWIYCSFWTPPQKIRNIEHQLSHPFADPSNVFTELSIIEFNTLVFTGAMRSLNTLNSVDHN